MIRHTDIAAIILSLIFSNHLYISAQTCNMLSGRHWLCNPDGTTPGSNCIQAKLDDITGYPSREQCEEECPGILDIVQLYDLLTAGDINYPFMAELEAMVDEARSAPSPDLSNRPLYRKFDSFVKMGGEILAKKYINGVNSLSNYLSRYVKVLPTFRIHTPLIEYQDTVNLRQLAHNFLESINWDKSHPKYHIYRKWSRDMIKFGYQLDESRTDMYYNITDPELICYFFNYKPDNEDRFNPKVINKCASRLTDIASMGPEQRLERATKTIIEDYTKMAITQISDSPAVIISVLLMFGYSEQHVTSLYIVPNKSLFYFEPHINTHWSKNIEQLLQHTLSGFMKQLGVTFSSARSIGCPVGMQKTMPFDYGSCQIWNMLMMSLFAINPGKTPEHIMQLALAMRSRANLLTKLFAFHLYKLQQGGAEYNGQPLVDSGNITPAKFQPKFDDTFWAEARKYTEDNPVTTKLLDAIQPRPSFGWTDKNVANEFINMMVNSIEDGDYALVGAAIKLGRYGNFLKVEPMAAALAEVGVSSDDIDRRVSNIMWGKG